MRCLVSDDWLTHTTSDKLVAVVVNRHHAVAWNWMAKHKGGLRKVPTAKGHKPAIHKRAHSEIKQQVKAKPPVNSRVRATALQYDEYQRILCIGEGNFSFARALVRKLEGQGQLLTATAYDTEEVVWEKYEVSRAAAGTSGIGCRVLLGLAHSFCTSGRPRPCQ